MLLYYTHPFNGLLSGTTRGEPVQKGKIWILLKQETVSGSGISWAVCKSAPRSRQITTPAFHHLVFYQMPFLPPIQQHPSTEGTALNVAILPCKYLKTSDKLQALAGVFVHRDSTQQYISQYITRVNYQQKITI